jgi:DNA-binding LacI/PurR family transcriptional regulator
MTRSVAGIRDVARRAEVSPATVSRVLNDDPKVGEQYRRRVMEAVAELDYRPNRLARNLRMQRSATVGVVVSDIENPHFSETVRAVEDLAYQRGYRVLVCNTDESPEKQREYLGQLIDERVLGVILSPSDPDGAEITEMIDARIPVVAYDREVSDPRADVVIADNVRAAWAATQLLIDAGHQNIAYVGGRREVETGAERLDGFELTMRAAGLTPRSVDGAFKVDRARAAVGELLAEADRPTALVVGNNLMTIGVLGAIRDHEIRVPDDVALVAIDDPFWAEFVAPPLTTVAQPIRRMAADAMELLLDRVAGTRTEPRRIVHDFELRRRVSCGTGPRD